MGHVWLCSYIFSVVWRGAAAGIKHSFSLSFSHVLDLVGQDLWGKSVAWGNNCSRGSVSMILDQNCPSFSILI